MKMNSTETHLRIADVINAHENLRKIETPSNLLKTVIQIKAAKRRNLIK